MLYSFDDGWIEYKKLTLKGYQLFKQGLNIESLAIHITDWSESAPINVTNVGKLKSDITEGLKRKLLESVEPILSMDKMMLQNWLKIMLNESKIVGKDLEQFEYIKSTFYDFVMLFIDHKGNIIQLPEPGGMLDQPLDWLIFLLVFKAVFVEKIANENKRKNS